MNKYISYVNPSTNMRGFLVAIFIIALLGFSVGVVVVSNNRNQSSTQDPQDGTATQRFSSPNMLVYGYWSGDYSEIKGYDLSNGQTYSLATLPSNIKHLRVLSPTEIVYIGNTDESDYGSEISVSTITGDNNKVVVQTSDGYGIDDYRISPNGQYIATWEVSPVQGSSQLYGGSSRVFVTDINSGVKNQIYNEVANVPVHYPVAVTDDGRVFMDTFLPNDVIGWAYGMSVSDFSGANIQEITSMQNGTYASQPSLSPDGTRLLFLGYDGFKGNGTDEVQNVRRAIISSNTIETLDINSLTRAKLSNLSNENFYSSANWDDISGSVIFSLASKNPDETGIYSYNLNSSSYNRVLLDNPISQSATPKKSISSLGGNINLVGNVTTSSSTLGNLGSHYDQVLDNVYVINGDTNEIITLDIQGGFIQPIIVKPSSYFGSNAIEGFASSGKNSAGVGTRSQEQIQLNAFTIKPTLAPVRTEQQSEQPSEHPSEQQIPSQENPRPQVEGPACREVAATACNELMGTSFTDIDARDSYDQVFVPNPAWGQCVKNQWVSARQAGLCANSPLYLYGENNASVNVRVGTPISNNNAPYSPLSGFAGKLTGDGGIRMDSSYSSLEFDFIPAYKYQVPNRGIILNRTTMAEQLNDYAQNLGMNEKETLDFINHIKTQTHSDKIFISHFSNEISQKILPLYFDPKPQSYTNIVFYVDDTGKNYSASYQTPKFEKIIREGYTAVEVSYIFKR